MSALRLALSMGDAAGVGPELCCRVCADPQFAEHELIVYGNRRLLDRVAATLQLACPQADDIQPGQVQAASGALAGACIEQAIQDCLAKTVDGMVTCPVNKKALSMAGAPFTGHTEWLQDRCHADDCFMLMYDQQICVALATCHQSLASVPQSINKHDLVRMGSLVHQFLCGIGIDSPQLAMCGLNPHAGEQGLFGNEEIIINQAASELRAAGIACSDALPPDTAFTALMRERYDAHLCMYHDQALIPFKTLAFDLGVNLTLGLPIIRSSVDHGTAFDIAWQGSASSSSLVSAINIAIQLANAKRV